MADGRAKITVNEHWGKLIIVVQ